MKDVKMGLTIEEAAEMSGIGRNTMRKLVDWGKLPVLKVGRKTIIRRDALENFMTLRRACVYAPAWTGIDAAGNRPALSGVVPPLRRRDNIRGTEDGRRRTKERR